jgi:hypothetical protein
MKSVACCERGRSDTVIDVLQVRRVGLNPLSQNCAADGDRGDRNWPSLPRGLACFPSWNLVVPLDTINQSFISSGYELGNASSYATLLPADDSGVVGYRR